MNLKDVLIENDNKRIDSEYFKKDFLKFFHDVANLRPLGSLVKDGYRVVYENTKIIEKEESLENGYPIFLQATDLDTPFIKMDNLYHVDNEQWERYPKGRITKGEILIEVKGKIDKVAIVPEDFPEKTLVSGSLFKLSVNKKISKHVLLTYLICKFGVAFKDRYKTNLLISFVSKPDLYRIPVPTFSKPFEYLIDDLFDTILKSQKLSKQIFSQAESILSNEIGLQSIKHNKEAVNIKNFKVSFAVTKRLDAEYYQKKYDDYLELIYNYKNGYKNLSLACDLKDNNFNPKENTTYKYIELSNIGKSGDVTGCTEQLGKNLPSRARRIVNAGNVVISSIEGSLQSCAVIPLAYDSALCSTGFYVINSKLINSETLLILFKSSLMQEIMKQNCSGTILTAMNKEEFCNIPVPLIDNKIQEKIANLLAKSFELKAQSERLLEVAKKAVEMTIEINEEEAMKYIKTQK